MPNRNTTRNQVAAGEIFSVSKGGVFSGSKRYVALGSNGKFASYNLGSGRISYAPLSRGDKNVIVTGLSTIESTIFATSEHNKAPRNDLVSGDLFTIAKGNNIYMHLGKNQDGDYVSLNLRSHDYAVGNGRGKATVIGFGELTG